jgi:hypothetical protein
MLSRRTRYTPLAMITDAPAIVTASGDVPKVIWGEEHGSMDMHMHHPG